MSANKIRRGFFSFSMVTRPGAHQDYNAWHLYDHIPENMALQGVVHGQRWVSPPAYAARRPAADAALALHQYMTLYLFEEPVAQAAQAFLDLGPALDAAGRFFKDRKSLMSGPFELVGAQAAPRVLVSPQALPYRPNTGLFVTVDDLPDPSKQADVESWMEAVRTPDMLQVRHVAGVWRFRALHTERVGRTAPPLPRGRTICVHYLDGDPLEMLDDFEGRAAHWRSSGRWPDFGGACQTLLASLYRTIAPDSRFDWFD